MNSDINIDLGINLFGQNPNSTKIRDLVKERAQQDSPGFDSYKGLRFPIFRG